MSKRKPSADDRAPLAHPPWLTPDPERRQPRSGFRRRGEQELDFEDFPSAPLSEGPDQTPEPARASEPEASVEEERQPKHARRVEPSEVGLDPETSESESSAPDQAVNEPAPAFPSMAPEPPSWLPPPAAPEPPSWLPPPAAPEPPAWQPTSAAPEPVPSNEPPRAEQEPNTPVNAPTPRFQPTPEPPSRLPPTAEPVDVNEPPQAEHEPVEQPPAELDDIERRAAALLEAVEAKRARQANAEPSQEGAVEAAEPAESPTAPPLVGPLTPPPVVAEPSYEPDLGDTRAPQEAAASPPETSRCETSHRPRSRWSRRTHCRTHS